MTFSENIEFDEDVKEFQAAIRTSELRKRDVRFQGVLSLALLLATSSCLFLLTDLGPLHRYWNYGHLGGIADVAWLASLIFTVYKVGLWWAAWQTHRETEKDFHELVADRYGVQASHEFR